MQLSAFLSWLQALLCPLCPPRIPVLHGFGVVILISISFHSQFHFQSMCCSSRNQGRKNGPLHYKKDSPCCLPDGNILSITVGELPMYTNECFSTKFPGDVKVDVILML